METNHKALQIGHSSLPNLRDPRSVRAALADRLLLSEAIGIVAHMLRGYPQKAGDSYIGALAETLCRYPRCVTARASDVVDGVPATTKFLPTPADVIAWCERETASLRGIVDRHDHFENLALQAQRRAEQDAAQAAARKARPPLDELKAKHGPNWGIGSADEDSAVALAANLALGQRANRKLFERECTAAGIDPNGLVSPTLHALLRSQREAAE